MPQVFSDKDNPVASIQISHIYAVDPGLHHIKFIINPVDSQVLWIINRNIENFLDIWAINVNWKNLKENPNYYTS